jgi:hypothetical protein
MNFEFSASPFDGGTLGRYYASHAAVKMVGAAPDEPFAVSKPLCLECKRYLQHEAKRRAHPQVVADPVATYVFHEDGQVEVMTGS